MKKALNLVFILTIIIFYSCKKEPLEEASFSKFENSKPYF